MHWKQTARQQRLVVVERKRATEKPVVKDGEIRIRPMMEVTLSFDHRVIDGGLAQKFLNIIQRNLEDAVRLLA